MKQTRKPLTATLTGFAAVLLTAGLLVTFPQSGYAGKGGAFVGGLIGGRFLAAGRPSDVFFVCALLAAIWLALQSFGRFRSS